MSNHPDFPSEKAALESVINFMEQMLREAKNKSDKIKRIAISDYTDSISLQAKKQWTDYQLNNFNDHIDKPYIGRVIYKENDSDIVDDLYIGYFGFDTLDGMKIIDWRTTFALNIWSGAVHKNVSYIDNAGYEVDGELFLKRNFDIESKTLLELYDTFNRLAIDEASSEIQDNLIDPELYLRLVLQGKIGKGLGDIVASIQEQQKAIIRANPDQILIVQGAAGSGKTSIALHRISVLSFKEDYRKTIESSQVLIIGANKVFLEFIASAPLLSRLNIGHVNRNTFTGWASLLIGQRLEANDGTLVELLDETIPLQKRRNLYQMARAKGKMTFKKLLDKWIKIYQMDLPPNELKYVPKGFGSLDMEYRIPQTILAGFIEENSNLPLNDQHNKVMSKVLDFIIDNHKKRYQNRVNELKEMMTQPSKHEARLLNQWKVLIKPYDNEILEQVIRRKQDEPSRRAKARDELRRRGGTISDGAIDKRIREDLQNDPEVRSVYQVMEKSREDALRAFKTEIENSLRQDFEVFWPRIQAKDLYIELMNHPDFLSEFEICAGVTLQGLRVVSDLRVEDITPIVYIDLCLNGKSHISRHYDHIVIDEAQDLSPFQFWLLRQFVTSGSMTILGDLAQSIHSYRGLSSWEQLREVFSEDVVLQKEIEQTYRSTFEIMQFANNILQNKILKGKYSLARPFERHGPPVEWIHSANERDYKVSLTQNVKSFTSKYENVAIICKSAKECEIVASQLVNMGTAFTKITNGNSNYKGGLVIIPAHLTKGIEFQACIVSNVGDKFYSETELDGRILYVACTRALHELVILWTGDITPHLSEAATLE